MSGNVDEGKKREKRKRENGGRYGYDDYTNAPTTEHYPDGLKTGDACQCCGKGKYYYTEPQKQLSFKGSPPIVVDRHLKHVLKCNACGKEAVAKINITKWTNSAKSIITLHKIHGMGWNKQERIQHLCGTPVSKSTLWEQSLSYWQDSGKFIAAELYKLAAEGSVWHSDDTSARILETMKTPVVVNGRERSSHTTTICSKYGEHKIIIYETSSRYCRENWAKLLKTRQSNEKVILMTDASNQSLASGKELKLVKQSICLGGHVRNKFKDVEGYYPEVCKKFLDLVAKLYKNEGDCKGMSAKERLKYHQVNSQSIIDEMYTLIDALITNKEVEPNSRLGKIFNYCRNHKKGLTAFLRIAGAPLDNNISENALRVRVIQRKISLFYKTEFSAEVLDGLNGIAATCEANGVNTHKYQIWILDNWKEVQKNSNAYLPWEFKKLDAKQELEKAQDTEFSLRLDRPPIGSEISSGGVAVMN